MSKSFQHVIFADLPCLSATETTSTTWTSCASSARDVRRRAAVGSDHSGFGVTMCGAERQAAKLRRQAQVQAATQRLSGERGALSLTNASECVVSRAHGVADSHGGEGSAQRECLLAAC